MENLVMGKKKQSRLERKADPWDPELMLEKLIKGEETFDDKWEEKSLPKLVDMMIDNYKQYGGINHLEGKDLPSKENVIEILKNLLTVIFPGYLGKTKIIKTNTRYFLGNTFLECYSSLVTEIEKSLKFICKKVSKCTEDVCHIRAQIVASELLEKIPDIRMLLRGDIRAAYDGDPAAKSIDEVILSYPCVLAITIHRISHELFIRGVPLVPRIMNEYAHSRTGIDIHPGAKIGKNIFIDHGTGVVIGETTEIGDNVKIYQSVTLGALSFPKDERGRIIKGRKRHPTIGNNVIIYSGATILGSEAIVGNNAIVGGNVWITSSIPSGTKVTIVTPELSYKGIKNKKD